MKLSNIILALCAAHQASAFVIPTPKSQSIVLNAQNYQYTYGNIPASSEEAAKSLQGSGGAEKQTSVSVLGRKPTAQLWENVSPVIVQGGSLRTCSFDESIDRVQVLLRTDGRPLNANVDLWQGPDNTPQKMAVYLEDGSLRPFRAIVECPGATNTVSILNTGQIEYPLTAGIEAGNFGPAQAMNAKGRLVQGGAVYTVPFSPSVASIQILLKTDGRPMTARCELLQGPNNIKQVMEIYLEDGKLRPFCVVMDTPGAGNVVRIQNTATLEYPLTAWVEPYLEEAPSSGPGEGMTWR